MKILGIFLLTAVVAHAQAPKSGPWEMQQSGTTASLRGIHAVGGGVVWASGTDGTVLRTEDSGYMWQSCAMPPGAEKLDFRGIWAWDADTAIVMSSGPGDQSRLYKTIDGCSHWKLLFTNPDKDGFWDAVQFWDKDHGLILGDPIEDWRAKKAPYLKGLHFVLLQTDDGGKSWHWKYPGRGEMPAAGTQGSGAFAASNSALVIQDRWAWFGTGGKSGPFVYTGIQIQGDVTDKTGKPLELEGFAWLKPVAVPIASSGDATGIFSLGFRLTPTISFSGETSLQIPAHGMAVGGDYTKPNEPTGTAAWTADGGQHWTAAVKPPHGYRSAVAWDADAKAWITAGTNGTDMSMDDGKTWQPLDDGNWNALSLPWVVGPKGRIAKLGALPPHK